MKQFIEALVLFEEKGSLSSGPEKSCLIEYFDFLREKIKDIPEYQNYYQQLKQKKDLEENVEDFIKKYYGANIKNSFSLENIEKYNYFKKDSIVNFFKKDNLFYKEFFDYFSYFGKFMEGYQLSNNLFQAYKLFLEVEENKVKKNEIKRMLEFRTKSSLIYKLLN